MPNRCLYTAACFHGDLRLTFFNQPLELSCTVLAQAALITQEPIDESALAEEMTEDKRILKLIFKNPNTYSVIQGVMMLEQDGEEVTKENSLFNDKSVTNEDI